MLVSILSIVYGGLVAVLFTATSVAAAAVDTALCCNNVQCSTSCSKGSCFAGGSVGQWFQSEPCAVSAGCAQWTPYNQLTQADLNKYSVGNPPANTYLLCTKCGGTGKCDIKVQVPASFGYYALSYNYAISTMTTYSTVTTTGPTQPAATRRIRV